MSLEERKYHFIQELFGVQEEQIMTALEKVLKKENKRHLEISNEDKMELDKRIKLFEKDPDNLLEWDEVKNKW